MTENPPSIPSDKPAKPVVQRTLLQKLGIIMWIVALLLALIVRAAGEPAGAAFIMFVAMFLTIFVGVVKLIYDQVAKHL